jgi:hypothetical protein
MKGLVFLLLIVFAGAAIAGERDFLHQGVFYKNAKVISVEGDKATISISGGNGQAIVPVSALPPAVKAEAATMIEAAKMRVAAASGAAAATGNSPMVRLSGKVLQMSGRTIVVQCEVSRQGMMNSMSSLNANKDKVEELKRKAAAEANRPARVTGIFVVDGHPGVVAKQIGSPVDVDAVKTEQTVQIEGRVYPRYKVILAVE